MNTAGAVARGREHRAGHQQRAVGEQHPPLRQSQRELDREYGADRVGGVGHPQRKGHRLHAHVQLPRDDRAERLQRSRQAQVRNQGEHDHRGHRRITASQRTLSHSAFLLFRDDRFRRRTAAGRGREALFDAAGDVVGEDLGEVGLDAVQRQRRDVSRVGLGSIDVGRHVRVHVGDMQRGDVDAVGGELLAGGVRHRPRGGLRGAVGTGGGEVQPRQHR